MLGKHVRHCERNIAVICKECYLERLSKPYSRAASSNHDHKYSAKLRCTYKSYVGCWIEFKRCKVMWAWLKCVFTTLPGLKAVGCRSMEHPFSRRLWAWVPLSRIRVLLSLTSTRLKCWFLKALLMELFICA